MPEVLLRVKNLRVNFYTYAGVVKALDGVSFEIYKGEAFGLVGETGCGKSVTAASILRLVDKPGRIVDGEIIFEGEDLLKKSEREMREIRGSKIAIVFQDPMTYLNPVLTIGDQIAETIREHQDLTVEALEIERNEYHNTSAEKPSKKALREAVLRRVEEALKMVRMPDPRVVIDQYPHELSGGMRQRAMIAMAISCNPKFLILDEATTFLDVTIQRQILELVKDLKDRLGCTLMIITHDMGIIAETCDRVAVMYAGTIAECAETKRIFSKPLHPYTRGLLDAIPLPTEDVKVLKPIPGFVPNLINPPPGCRFHPRCPEAMEVCSRVKPELREVEPGHQVACHLYG
ncbi:ABC transporter ATP-binding protein [Candidatus Bathyarchaeota archaeon]|nr:MAG: ABC transporter ATP-binding protein [Candidatus Bathyarchaeota archaeon]